MKIGKVVDRAVLGDFKDDQDLKEWENQGFAKVLKCENEEGMTFFLVLGVLTGEKIEMYEPGEFDLHLDTWHHASDKIIDKYGRENFSEFLDDCKSLIKPCRPTEKRRVDEWDLE